MLVSGNASYINNMSVSKNRGTPKWMVYDGKPHYNGWFGGTIIFWKHLYQLQYFPDFLHQYGPKFDAQLCKGEVFSCSSFVGKHYRGAMGGNPLSMNIWPMGNSQDV